MALAIAIVAAIIAVARMRGVPKPRSIQSARLCSLSDQEPRDWRVPILLFPGDGGLVQASFQQFRGADLISGASLALDGGGVTASSVEFAEHFRLFRLEGGEGLWTVTFQLAEGDDGGAPEVVTRRLKCEAVGRAPR